MTTATNSTIPNIARRTSIDRRSEDDIRRHYEIERELADRLRHAPRDQRLHLYASIYDELCERVPDIPGWNVPMPPAAQRLAVANKVKFLTQFLEPQGTFLELGPGDCAVSLAMCGHSQQVYAVDVSALITSRIDPPENFKLILSDGVSIDVPAGSVDVAYSSNLMEHLHPDDAAEQVRNVCRALKPGGAYVVITPTRLSGPHDVSKYFDDHPTGLHLREYSTADLATVFRQNGFGRVQPYMWFKERLIVLPLWPVTLVERLLLCLPRSLRQRACRSTPLKYMLSRVVAYAPTEPR